MKRTLGLKSRLARLSAVILFIGLIWGCGRVPPVSEIEPPSSRLPFVRVLLDNGERLHTIGSIEKDEFTVDCYKDGRRYSYVSRRDMIVKGNKRSLALSNQTGYMLDENVDRMVIAPRGKRRIITVDGKEYRGLAELAATSGQITLVNVVNVEDYLKGVVPLEIGPTEEKQMEAIKAQAVAARTYAMAHLGQFGQEAGYDLKSSVADQLYGGVAVENDRVSRAVEDTRGIVAVYKDSMINAYYHSTCGGMTDDIEDVWDKNPQPYLVSVSDNGACKISKYYTWDERYTGGQIGLRLNQYLTQERGEQVNVGRLTDVKVGSRTPGGRVASIIFETSSGHYIFDKEKVRWVITQSAAPDAILRSANFSFTIDRDGGGNVSEVVFHGRGYGHGVGMCQMGAKGMAGQGVAFDSILALYYQGTQLKKLY